MSAPEEKLKDSGLPSEPADAQPGAPPAATGIPTDPELPAAPPPEETIAALENEKAELKDRYLRLAAEFDNWKKRARKEATEQEAKVRENVIRDFLEVVDNLERATGSWNTGAEPDAKSIRDGVDLVLRLFKSKLERYSVTPLEAKGQPFDPRLHDAISQAPSAEAPAGTVLHELQKGYRVGDRLLRPAMVVVAIAPPPKQGDGAGTPISASDVPEGANKPEGGGE